MLDISPSPGSAVPAFTAPARAKGIRFRQGWLVAALVALLAAPSHAQQPAALTITPLAERVLAALPPGPLFWRIEHFPGLDQAQAVAGPSALATEVAGRAWLFTLGPAGGAWPGGLHVAELGPLPAVSAARYLLRVNDLSGPAGGVTPVHTHPGSETFHVLSSEVSQRTHHGVDRIPAGQSMVGHGRDTVMQVSNSGTVPSHALVLFVVDADRPFTEPASFR